VVQPFRGVQDIPLAVRQHGVAVLRAQPPVIQPVRDFLAPRETQSAGFAVSLSGTQLLSHAAALGGRTEVQIATGDGTVMTARVAAYERATGLVLLQTDSAAGQPITMVGTTPAAGMLSVAAGWLEGGDVTVPVFVTSVAADRFEIGSAHGTVWPGMPLYNLDGEPFAIAATDGQAYPLLLAAPRLLALAAAGDGPTSFGIAFQDLTEGLTRTFGTAGAIVSDIVPAGPADRAGILAGDTLLAVDKVDIESAEMAAAVLSAVVADSAATLRIRRSGRNRTITVTPATTFEVDALVHDRTAGDASAPLARALFALERLAIAGVPETARVVAVNGRSVTTPAQAQAAERRGQPTVLTLRHDDNRFFAALEASK